MSLTLNELPQHSVLIAPAHMHSILRYQLLAKQQGSIGLSILTLRGYLQRFEHKESERLDVICKYRERLRAFPAKVYHTIHTSLDFMTQCYEFIEEMKLYDILCDDLPEENDANIELKQLITQLYPIITPQDHENTAWDLIKHQRCQNVFIMDTLWSAQDTTRITRLQEYGAQLVQFPLQQPVAQYFHSINKRKEVEAAAQMILIENMRAQDLNIIICDPSYQPLIKQVFGRYHIPYTIMKQTKTSSLRIRFQLLLQYYLKPSSETLLDLIEMNTFPVPYAKEFSEYIRTFGKDLDDSFDHLHTQAHPSQLITKEELERLCRLEDHAQEGQMILRPLLAPLLQAQHMEDVFMKVYELACINVRAGDTQAISVLQKIQEIFVSYLPYCHAKEDLPFLIELLEEIQESASDTHLQGAFISELHAPLPPRNTCMVFGCTQKLYPAFPAKKGLFDESYVRSLTKIPSMSERNHIFMKQLETSLSGYCSLLVSYPIGGYDGKANEGALEMEQFLQKDAQYREPLQAYQPISMSYQVQKESMAVLFLRDHKIFGSISAFERYVRCPFSYFLTYGLKIREPIDYAFSQSRIGTLSHFVLETMVNRYQKQYSDAPMEEVATILEEELQAMALAYPLFAPQVPLLKRRILHALKKNLSYLHHIEEHSHLTPFACEKEFWWDLPLSDELTLCLHGFIDRIDASQGYLRIIDYKSSAKSLSETDVFSGLQLQLITYALYARTTWQKEVLGAFYYSLKNENIHAGAGKMTRRPVAYVAYGHDELNEARLATKRLRGWVMHKDIDIIDDDGTHILGVRANKEGVVKARKTYNMDELERLFKEMYQIIGTRILSADIACSPTEEACMFCPYHEICRFQGYPRSSSPIVETDEHIYQGGE